MNSWFDGRILLLLASGILVTTAEAETLPPAFGGNVTYTLANGFRSSPGRVLGVEPGTFIPGFRDTVRVAVFIQSGGTHLVNGPLTLQGYVETCRSCSGRSYNARYQLSGGQLTSHSLGIRTGSFTQSGGTNNVIGDLTISPGWYDATIGYELRRGRLITSNGIINVRPTYRSFYQGFRQSGGIYVVRNLLALNGNLTAFGLSGGKLFVRDMALTGGAAFSHSGGLIKHTGTLSLSGGHWAAGTNSQLGALRLKTGGTNSSLSLPWSPKHATRVRFAASAELPWDPDALLIIHNWRTATNGVAANRVFFGTNETGLTAQQLGQIRFRDPASFAPGDYPAEIRSTGELVPAPQSY